MALQLLEMWGMFQGRDEFLNGGLYLGIWDKTPLLNRHQYNQDGAVTRRHAAASSSIYLNIVSTLYSDICILANYLSIYLSERESSFERTVTRYSVSLSWMALPSLNRQRGNSNFRSCIIIKRLWFIIFGVIITHRNIHRMASKFGSCRPKFSW